MERFGESLGDCHRFNAGHVSATTASATHVHNLTSHCTSTSSLSGRNRELFFPQLYLTNNSDLGNTFPKRQA